MLDPETVTALLATWGYAALLLLLLLTGVGSPVPEDLLLLVAGYLIGSEVFLWPVSLPLCLAGVVASDLALYSAGRHIAWRTSALPPNRFMSAQRLERATGWFARYGDGLVFFARLVPGTRALVFVTAGLRGVPVWRFLQYDLLGAALWVPAVLWVGHRAGASAGGLETALAWLSRGAPWAAVVACALLLLWVLLGREESKL